VNISVEFSDIECVSIDISRRLMSNNYRIIAYYRPPGTSSAEVEYASKSVQLFRKLCSTHKTVIMLGDFNLPDINWSLYHAPDNSIYNDFLLFINSYGLTQHVNVPTRQNNILDLVLSTDNKFISELNVLPPIGNSDHGTILFSTCVNTATTSGEQDVLSYDWNRANYDQINFQLSLVNWNK